MRWLCALAIVGCGPGVIADPSGGALDSDDAGAATTSTAPPPAPPAGELDRARVRAQFPTTTELVRYIVAPGCAAERNECHNSEDFPDLSTEGNLWNLVGLRCNAGLGERTEVEDFCEPLADELRIDEGPDAGLSARIARIDGVLDDEGALVAYDVTLDEAPAGGGSGLAFTILRNATPIPGLGGGGSLETEPGRAVVRVRRPSHIPDPSAVLQGDENGNGVWGAGRGALITPGSPRDSYVVRRLLGEETGRVRMPLGANADTATEVNPPLTRAEVYAITSWITCMEPGDGPYSPIRYDCAENAANAGRW